MGLQDIGRYNIQFHFNGKTIAIKVTKFSTCDDVIHMVFHKVGLPVTKVMLYAIFERTGSAERKLNGKFLVYKVWRSWGCENKHFEFHIKSKETKLRIKSNLSNKSAESCIDDLFLDVYNRKADMSKSSTSDNGSKSVSFNLESDKTNTSRSKQKVSGGKQIVLTRYLYDLFSRSAKSKRKQAKEVRRERADGAENDDFRCGDGSVYNDSSIGRSKHEKCRQLWDKYSETDSESDSDYSFSGIVSDDEHDLTHNGTVTLDTAFIKSSRDSDSDEGIDVTSVTSVDLDTAFVDDFDTKLYLSDTDETERTNTPDTMYNEISSERENGLELNITDDKLLKELFGKAGRETMTSEDDEMDSFMRSRLDSF